MYWKNNLIIATRIKNKWLQLNYVLKWHYSYLISAVISVVISKSFFQWLSLLSRIEPTSVYHILPKNRVRALQREALADENRVDDATIRIRIHRRNIWTLLSLPPLSFSLFLSPSVSSFSLLRTTREKRPGQTASLNERHGWLTFNSRKNFSPLSRRGCGKGARPGAQKANCFSTIPPHSTAESIIKATFWS